MTYRAGLNDEYRPWDELALAIVKQAVTDYKVAYRKVLRHPDDQMAKDICAYERRFFFGEWFEQLSDLDGPQMVKLIEQQAEAEHKESIRKKLEQQKKELEKQIDAIERELMKQMSGEDLQKSEGQLVDKKKRGDAA